MREDLDLAVSVVRFLRPDDIFVLVPWAEVEDVELCVDALVTIVVHLAQDIYGSDVVFMAFSTPCHELNIFSQLV